MRKGQRFTPTKIRNWQKLGRGKGLFSDYEPWHQVTRGDPSSRGRSQLALWVHTRRGFHFLSDGESDMFGFITMLPNILDVREQVPLNLHEHVPELAAYSARHLSGTADGTLACAEQLKIRYPKLRKLDDIEPWVMTTDFVITLHTGPGEYELLAVSVKLDSELENPRTRDLLKLEKAYWNRQGVQWLLICPSLYEKRVSITIRMALGWGLPKQEVDIVPASYIEICARNSSSFHGRSLTECLNILRHDLQVSMDCAQRVFWQAVWKGALRLDLSRSSWPSEPVRLIDEDAFRKQNPIAARRSICI